MAELIPGVANIGKRERQKRVIGGVIATVAAVALAAGLIWKGAAPAWRLTVALPAMFALVGFLQARAKTCVANARRGVCNMDDGDKPVTDPARQAQLEKIARGVMLWSFLGGLAVGVALVFVPL